MAQITDRQKDSEIIAKLIYMAFVAPERPGFSIGEISYVPFCAALELYARAAARETVSESDAPADAPCDGDSCPVELPEIASEPDKAAAFDLDDFEPVPLRAHDTHTHTHTAGANDGGGGQPVAFAGKGSGEKRKILEHLQRFVDTYSGARRRIAKEANGALTYEELLAMSEKKPLPLAKWRIAEAAMRRIEAQNGS